MDTLHKKLSEIRDLRAEEFDLVGGGEGSSGTPTWQYIHYNTTSMTSSGQQTDDGTQQYQAVDSEPDYPPP